MFADLAPVDSLIQRAGRLWGHDRDERPMPAAEFVILSPEPVNVPGPGWIRDLLPGTAAVYDDPALLWRGARALLGQGSLTTSDDMRRLIEEAAGAVPRPARRRPAPRLAEERGEAEVVGVLSCSRGGTRASKR